MHGPLDWEGIRGSWTRLRGRVRMHWCRLTDDRLGVIEGRREMMVGRLQGRYRITVEQAERQVSEWESSKAGRPRRVG